MVVTLHTFCKSLLASKFDQLSLLYKFRKAQLLALLPLQFIVGSCSSAINIHIVQYYGVCVYMLTSSTALQGMNTRATCF